MSTKQKWFWFLVVLTVFFNVGPFAALIVWLFEPFGKEAAEAAQEVLGYYLIVMVVILVLVLLSGTGYAILSALGAG